MQSIYKEGAMNKKTETHKNVTFRFTADFTAQLNKKLKEMAKKSKWSVNTLVGDILEKWMEANG